MSESNERWCVGSEEAFFGSFASKEEAIAGAADELDVEEHPPGSTFYVGRCVPFTPRLDVDLVLDHLRNQAYELAGEEPTEDWLAKVAPEVQADLERRLADVIEGWLAQHDLAPTFYGVEDVTSHRMPEVDRA